MLKKITIVMLIMISMLICLCGEAYAAFEVKYHIYVEDNDFDQLKEKIKTELANQEYYPTNSLGYQFYMTSNPSVHNREWIDKKGNERKATITISESDGPYRYTADIYVTAIALTPGEMTEENKTNNDSADPIDNPDYFKPTGNTGTNTRFKSLANNIIATLKAIGITVSVLAIMIIGIRYMFASIEERATYKEIMMPYVIGAGMVFAITVGLDIIYSLVTSINF